MRQRHRIQGAEVARQFHGLFLGAVHQRRMDLNIAFHAQAQRLLQRQDRLFATIRVAAVVSLRDADHQVADIALIRIGGRVGQEDQVAARHKRVRQARRGIQLGPDVYPAIGQCVTAQCGERVDR